MARQNTYERRGSEVFRKVAPIDLEEEISSLQASIDELTVRKTELEAFR